MAEENITENTTEVALEESADQETTTQDEAIQEVVTETVEIEETEVDSIDAAEVVADEKHQFDELSDNLVGRLPAVEDEDAPRKEVPGGRAYEVAYIVRADAQNGVDDSTTRVQEIIEAGEGAVDNVRASETRRLAYPINKQTEGIYVVTNARFAPSVSEELERYFRIEETVLRYVILREED